MRVFFILGIALLLQSKAPAQNELYVPYPSGDVEFAKDAIRASKDFQPYLIINGNMTMQTVGIPLVRDSFSQSKTPRFEVIQIVDSENLIARNKSAGTFWVEGIDTSTLTDESSFVIEQPCLLVGNKTYGTALGSTNTVIHIKIVSIPQELKDLQAELKKKTPIAAHLRVRNWQIAQKEWLIGRFRSYDGKILRLEKFSGHILELDSKSLPSRTKSAARKLQNRADKELELELEQEKQSEKGG